MQALDSLAVISSRRYFLPSGIVTVNCASELGLGCIPLFGGFEGNVRCCVVDHCESAHLWMQ